MAHLSIYLLGVFDVQLDTKPVTSFQTNKTRALLVYLAAAGGRSCQRVHLAGLLWPDWPEAQARTYLRKALANLRRILRGDEASTPFLLPTRQAIQFNPGSDYWLDVASLRDGLAKLPTLDVDRADEDSVTPLQTAVSLYRGDFLEGFYLDGCPAFEEWQLLTREQLRRQVREALGFLVQWHERRGDLAQATGYAWHRVELEPLMEAGHRQLMRLLARTGEGNLALAHYKKVRRLVQEELNAEPSLETKALVERIKASQTVLDVTKKAESWPPYLDEASTVAKVSAVFVDRKPELAQLASHLDAAMAGQGHVVFVIGDAGEGKTALVQKFAQLSQDSRSDLLVAGGKCSSHRGVGDPFLPFREILAQLTGDLEASWCAGEITRKHVRRLWATVPQTVEALLVHGPDLIDSLLPGAALVSRLEMLPGWDVWRERVALLMNRGASPIEVATPPQRALFQQFVKVLQVLASQRPLLLWLDDLQWCDLASIALLFHLGQRLTGSRILLLGTYRPEDLLQGREGQRHPLERIVHELQRQHDSTIVDLSQSDGRRFVDSYLDSEPNNLGEQFRDSLHGVSSGHALFTVELLRTLQEKGSLVRDTDGHWIEGLTIDWQILPARVETAIAERIERLRPELRRVLDVAAVHGERFIAQVIATVLDVDVRQIIQLLSEKLGRQHHLVAAHGIQRLGDQRLAHYRFRHILFQRYLVDSLDEVERTQLHEVVARSLEALYNRDPEELAAMAGQLAWHFQQAYLIEEAIPYLHRAGNQALRLAAHEEATTYFSRGLTLLEGLPNIADRRQLELELLMGLGAVQARTMTNAAPTAERTFTRALELCQLLGKDAECFRASLNLWFTHYHRGEMRIALRWAQDCLEIAQRVDSPGLILDARLALARNLRQLGQMIPAHEELAKAKPLIAEQRSQWIAHLYNPSVQLWADEALGMVHSDSESSLHFFSPGWLPNSVTAPESRPGNPFSRTNRPKWPLR